jgi:hypothetical protein
MPLPAFWAGLFTQKYTDFNDPARPEIEYKSLMLFQLDTRYSDADAGNAMSAATSSRSQVASASLSSQTSVNFGSSTASQ